MENSSRTASNSTDLLQVHIAFSYTSMRRRPKFYISSEFVAFQEKKLESECPVLMGLLTQQHCDDITDHSPQTPPHHNNSWCEINKVNIFLGEFNRMNFIKSCSCKWNRANQFSRYHPRDFLHPISRFVLSPVWIRALTKLRVRRKMLNKFLNLRSSLSLLTFWEWNEMLEASRERAKTFLKTRSVFH